MVKYQLNETSLKTTKHFSVKQNNDSGICSEMTHSCHSINSTSSGIRNLHKFLHPNKTDLHIPKYKLGSTESTQRSLSSSSTNFNKKDFLWHAEESIGYEKMRLLGKVSSVSLSYATA